MATSQPLASGAGLSILQQGGSAVDAAVGASLVAGVVEPMSTGLGGDVVALISVPGKTPMVLNASGVAPAEASIDAVRSAGLERLPLDGPDVGISVTVPGAPAGFFSAWERFGRLSFRDVVAPAIRYARAGFPVSEVIARSWEVYGGKIQSADPAAGGLLPNGDPPDYGDIIVLQDLARTLEMYGDSGPSAVYEGRVGAAIRDVVNEHSGCFVAGDLSGYSAQWRQPLNAWYRGRQVWGCPPNTQGVAALVALRHLQHVDIESYTRADPALWHLLIEAVKAGLSHAFDHVGDDSDSGAGYPYPSDGECAAYMRRALKGHTAQVPFATILPGSETVYVTCVDSDGAACSMMSSLYQDFGSGLVAPRTGILLNNRGALFDLRADSKNRLRGGRRPFNTLTPALVSQEGQVDMSLGVMGGFQQSQGLIQLLVNLIDFGDDVQAALDMPRFGVNVERGGLVELEEPLYAELAGPLATMGHEVASVTGYDRIRMGGGQAIHRNVSSGALLAGSDPRKDGAAVAW